MSVPSPDTRTYRQEASRQAASGQQRPVVVITRPEPRPVAASTPIVGYEQALHWRLTEREVQVLAGMACGRTNGEIGRSLFIVEDTVKTHTRRLFFKLYARDRAHAVHRAWELGILTRQDTL